MSEQKQNVSRKVDMEAKQKVTRNLFSEFEVPALEPATGQNNLNSLSGGVKSYNRLSLSTEREARKLLLG